MTIAYGDASSSGSIITEVPRGRNSVIPGLGLDILGTNTQIVNCDMRALIYAHTNATRLRFHHLILQELGTVKGGSK